MKKSFILISLLAGALIGCAKHETSPAVSNPGQKLVMDSIAAHGGLDRWYSNGLLQFRWTYHLTDRGPQAIVDTLQTIDLTSLAVTHSIAGSDTRFGWNAGETWIHPADASFAPPPKFWALTPIYFFGIPFIFNDPNARFELLDESIAFEGNEYAQVKITYTQEAGDSPDDYYTLLIDPQTKLVAGAIYIVTSPLVAPNGPTPPKLITFDNLVEIDGIKLAGGHRTFSISEDGSIGGLMRFTTISEVSFLERGSVDLSIPDGAKVE